MEIVEQISMDDVPRRIILHWENMVKRGNEFPYVTRPGYRFGMLSGKPKGEVMCFACTEVFREWELGRNHPCQYEDIFRLFTSRPVLDKPPRYAARLPLLEKRVAKLESDLLKLIEEWK